jgi:hypothetical protein
MTTNSLRRLGRAAWRSLRDAERRRHLKSKLLEHVEYDEFHDALDRPRYRDVARPAAGLPGGYILSANTGVYLLREGFLRRLLPIHAFGIARNGNTLYLGAASGEMSYIVAATLEGETGTPHVGETRVLASFQTRYHNERIHQIAFDDREGKIICANTRRNSILAVDPEAGSFEAETFLFKDATGYPIHTDHNHVNTVARHGSAVLFAAHNVGGNGSALGFVHEGTVRAYYYPSRGVHDLLIHDGAIMFTDSFKAATLPTNSEVNGGIVHAARFIHDDAIQAIPRRLAIRGLCVDGDALLAGASVHTKRENRGSDSGGTVLFFGPEGLREIIDGPFSQVYDIIRLDGSKTDRENPPLPPDALHDLFLKDVGELIYEGETVTDVEFAKL